VALEAQDLGFCGAYYPLVEVGGQLRRNVIAMDL
jgi:hypothetical protein